MGTAGRVSTRRQPGRAAWVSACLILHLSASIAGAQSRIEPAAQPGRSARDEQTALEELRALVDEQRELNRQQALEIDALRQRVDEASALAFSARTEIARLGQSSLQPAVPGAVDSQATTVEQGAKRLPELPEKLVTAGDFPGSIAVPGTDAAFKVGGEILTTLVHTLGPLGTDDRFIASSIPVGFERAGLGPRTTYTAAPSRFNVDLRTPWRSSGLRAFIESDFAGTGTTSRLRHAFLQTDRWLFGQTWSTFSDPEVQPVDIDFEGENALSRFRQAQARYSRTLRERLDMAVAIENPAPDLTSAQGVNLTPDVSARLRWEPAGGVKSLLTQPAHVQGAVLIRTLRGELVNDPDAKLSTGGFGGTVSGVLIPRWAGNDRIKFAAYGGRGVGRYITDLAATGGQDAVYDPTTNELRALPVASGYIAYEHLWRPSLQSSFTYGLVYVDNLDVQPDDALRRTQRGTANITWNPMPRADLVFEFLAGDRTNKSGERGTSSQFQAGWRLRF